MCQGLRAFIHWQWQCCSTPCGHFARFILIQFVNVQMRTETSLTAVARDGEESCDVSAMDVHFINLSLSNINQSVLVPRSSIKKVFHHTSFDMKIFACDARQSEIFDISSISTNCTGYVNIFLSLFHKWRIEPVFSLGYVHKFCLFYNYNFCILVDHLRIIITSLFKPELSGKTRKSVG